MFLRVVVFVDDNKSIVVQTNIMEMHQSKEVSCRIITQSYREA